MSVRCLFRLTNLIWERVALILNTDDTWLIALSLDLYLTPIANRIKSEIKQHCVKSEETFPIQDLRVPETSRIQTKCRPTNVCDVTLKMPTSISPPKWRHKVIPWGTSFPPIIPKLTLRYPYQLVAKKHLQLVQCKRLRPRQCGRRFHNSMQFDSNYTELCSWGQVNNMRAQVQIMAWRLSGDKPLTEPIHS